MKKKTLLAILGLISVLGCLPAQTDDPFGNTLRRMNDQMLRGLPPADSAQIKERLFILPADTAFFFQFDTTFSDGSRQFYFHYSPGQNPTAPLTDPLGLDRMIREFFGPDAGFDDPFFQLNPRQMPGDDGASRQAEDILPEERLRQEETQPTAKPQKNPPAAAPKSKPSDEIKTIRI